MSASPETPQPSARSPFAGCAILIICVLVLIFLVGFSTWALFRQADEIEKFTSDKPVTLEVVSLENQDARINDLTERLEGFRQSLDGDAETRLELTPADLNLAIAAYAPLSELKDSFHVRELREDGRLIADISFKMNGKPRRARENEDGFVASDPRYLNATLVTRPELAQGELVLRIDQIDVPGKTVAEPFRLQMSPHRITERYLKDPVIGPAMGKLTGLEVSGGKLILRKKPGEIAPQTITREQVDLASSRLFRALGVVSACFLGVVGLLLFIGFRLKKRRERDS